MTIPEEKLLLYKKWKPLSLKYINSFEANIEIEAFCSAYYQLFEIIIVNHKKILFNLG